MPLTHDEGALVILMDEVGSLSEDFRLRITARKRGYFDFVRQTLDDLEAAGKLQAVDTTSCATSRPSPSKVSSGRPRPYLRRPRSNPRNLL